MDVGEGPSSSVCFSRLHSSFAFEDQARNIPDLHSSQHLRWIHLHLRGCPSLTFTKRDGESSYEHVAESVA